MTATRTRNRRGEGAQLRDDIMAAAVALLDETGDESAVTLRAVARRVGIAAPSIYRHFADQPSIMLAVVQQAFDELNAELYGALRRRGRRPPDAVVRRLHRYLEFARRHPGRYRTMFGGLWMPDLEASSLTEADLHALGRGQHGRAGRGPRRVRRSRDRHQRRTSPPTRSRCGWACTGWLTSSR